MKDHQYGKHWAQNYPTCEMVCSDLLRDYLSDYRNAFAIQTLINRFKIVLKVLNILQTNSQSPQGVAQS